MPDSSHIVADVVVVVDAADLVRFSKGWGFLKGLGYTELKWLPGGAWAKYAMCVILKDG